MLNKTIINKIVSSLPEYITKVQFEESKRVSTSVIISLSDGENDFIFTISDSLCKESAIDLKDLINCELQKNKEEQKNRVNKLIHGLKGVIK